MLLASRSRETETQQQQVFDFSKRKYTTKQFGYYAFTPSWFVPQINILPSCEYKFLEVLIKQRGFEVKGHDVFACWVEMDEESWIAKTGLKGRQRQYAIKGLLEKGVIETHLDRFIIQIEVLRALYENRSGSGERVVQDPKAKEAREGQKIHRSCVAGGCARLGGLALVDDRPSPSTVAELETYYDTQVSRFLSAQCTAQLGSVNGLESAKNDFSGGPVLVPAALPGSWPGGPVPGGASGLVKIESAHCTAQLGSVNSLESTKLPKKQRVLSHLNRGTMKPADFGTKKAFLPPVPPPPSPLVSSPKKLVKRWPETVAAVESFGFPCGDDFLGKLLAKFESVPTDAALAVAVVQSYKRSQKTAALFFNTVPDQVALNVRVLAAAPPVAAAVDRGALVADSLRASAQLLAGRPGAADLVSEIETAAVSGVFDPVALEAIENKIAERVGKLLSVDEFSSVSLQVLEAVRVARKRGCSESLLESERATRLKQFSLKLLCGVSSLGAL